MANLVGLDAVLSRLGIVGTATVKKATEKSKVVAAKMENTAKAKRTWTDQTGDARRSITGSVDNKLGAVIIYLAIGVKYGVYLELANGGSYAIIDPTIQEYRTKYLNEYKDIL